ncbi:MULTISPECIES: HAD family hydrolase [Pontibacillus]|uniref:HAD family hydrolase n=1 Tax=Pontibacillus chungwhensis TaxID=265426 RepID=A0ABY8UZA0_9BACI|nr:MULTISPECIES: HAD-IA family hydrolase [Pontibacillus]MCD5325460.1 HAD family hydrolase [Pontibacillus sp. HN14]WIF98573.1 HAD family hydrolase [Pontibacillus chungwhensis]
MASTHAFLNQSHLLIFDLDGTLYEDTNHFDHFAYKLKDQLPKEKQEAFLNDYKRVQEGNHPLSIGKVYDAQEDIFWTWDPFTEQLSNPQSWEGKHVQSQTAETFPASTFDFERWIAIGDGWWPPYVLALHYGLPIIDCHQAYDDTKVDMSSQEGWLTQTPGLRPFLEEIKKEKTIVLMTNSEATDVDRLLKELNLHDLFDDRITSATKPVQTSEHFHELLKRYKVKPEEAVSVGDNFMNEIAPALQYGMHAVWLTPDEPNIEHEKLHPVRSLTDIL